MSAIIGLVLDDFKRSTTSLQEVIKAYDSPLGSPPKIDLATYLYSGSILVSHYDEIGPLDSNELFRS
jgi:hypothetical protein